MKYAVKLMYDGRRFSGFQVQPDSRTVQGELTERISDFFGCECNITGCSRTDAGVHARGFVAAISPKYESDGCRLTVPGEKLPRALNIVLPDDISVIGGCVVDDDFHPRYDAVWKKYTYIINDTPVIDPFENGLVYNYRSPIDDSSLEMMNVAASYLKGKHDFSSFSSVRSSVENKVRTIYDISVTRDDKSHVRIIVKADGFLYNMVRIITGTLLEVSQGKISPEMIPEIIAEEDRNSAGFTAPAEGLYLTGVGYTKEPDFRIV